MPVPRSPLTRTRRPSLFRPLALALALAGCGGDPAERETDAADAGAPDDVDVPDGVVAPDAAPDSDTADIPDATPDPCANSACRGEQRCDPETGRCSGPAPICGSCASDDDCGGPQDRCLTFNLTGESFCARDCSGDEEFCPPDYSCADIGGGVRQCVPDEGTCDWRLRVCTRESAPDVCIDGSICTSLREDVDGRCVPRATSDGACPDDFPHFIDDGSRPPFCLAPDFWVPEACGAFALGPNLEMGFCGDSSLCFSECAGGLACAPECGSASGCGPLSDCRPLQGEAPVCVPAACGCAELDPPLLAHALDALRFAPCSLGWTHRELALNAPDMVHDPWRLPWFDPTHRSPESIGRLPDRLPVGPAPDGQLASRALSVGADLLGAPFESAGPPADETVEEAIRRIFALAGDTPQETALARFAGEIDPAAEVAMGGLLSAIADAIAAREQSLAGVPEPTRRALFDGILGLVGRADGPPPNLSDEETRALLRGRGGEGAAVDLSSLFRAAAAIVEAIGPWRRLASSGSAGGATSLLTPFGRISIGSRDTDRYDADEDVRWSDPILLLVEPGGDDTYLIPGAVTAELENPVSVVLDLAGNDLWAYPGWDSAVDRGDLLPADSQGRAFDQPTSSADGAVSLSTVGRQGSARLGIALQVDLGSGDDRYRSLVASQGAGALGVGLLIDAGGSDEYTAERLSQGAALFGIGALIDEGAEGSDDRYLAWNMSMGFGFTRGLGLLQDAGGSDRYFAPPGRAGGCAEPVPADRVGEPIYASPQSPECSNSSMSQGFGFGRRADFSDRRFLSGGIGVLDDLGAGADEYTAGIFAQGTGYWFGAGVLLDGGGNDRYSGRWYSQGAAAHYAIGFLRDAGGNDVYNDPADTARLNACLGLGHDYSLGALIDEAGDDEYHVPNLSGGVGNDNGIGILVDVAGDDLYDAASSLAWGDAVIGADLAASLRRDVRGAGLFVDGAGADTYQYPGTDVTPADGTTWVQHAWPEGVSPNSNGAGVDLP